MSLFDLKVINSVLAELEEDRGIPREKVISAIEMALAAAYKKEYGKKGQIIRAHFNMDMGDVEFQQIKIVVDDSVVKVVDDSEDAEHTPVDDTDERIRFNPEHHIMIDDARRIKKDVDLDDEIEFPLEAQEDFGRIASQTAKQVIMQKIREAEKVSILEEYGEREGEVVSGHVQRFERGNLFVDLGRTTAILPYEEQIPGERYRQGERIRALLYKVDESPRGTFLKLSRSNPQFLVKLFEIESPELSAGTIEVKAVAREAGSRSKMAVITNDDHIDPVGALVGQRGVRVSTVTSELGGEKIDVIEWSEDTKEFIESALSPAEIMNVEINEEEHRALVEVTEDQQSLAIGRGGQNVRLAAKLTGWGIDIASAHGEELATAEENGDVEMSEETPKEAEEVLVENEDAESTESQSNEEERTQESAEDATADTSSDEETVVENTEDTETETSEEDSTEEEGSANDDDEPQDKTEEPAEEEMEEKEE